MAKAVVAPTNNDNALLPPAGDLGGDDVRSTPPLPARSALHPSAQTAAPLCEQHVQPPPMPLQELLELSESRRWEDRSRYEIEIASLRGDIIRRSKREAKLRGDVQEHEKRLAELRRHNKVLQHMLHDADAARRGALLEVIEQSAATTSTSGGVTPSTTVSPAELGALDTELHQALEGLRSFQLLGTPVNEWYRATAKVWSTLKDAFHAVHIPEKPTLKLVQHAKQKLLDDRRAVAKALRDLQYHQLRILRDVIAQPRRWEDAEEVLRDRLRDRQEALLAREVEAAQLHQQIAALTTQLDTATAQSKQAAAEFDAHKAQVAAELAATRTAAEATQRSLEERNAEAQRQIDSMRSDLVEREQAFHREREALERDLQSMRDLMQAAGATIRQLEQSDAAKQLEIEALTAARTAADARAQALSSDLEEIRMRPMLRRRSATALLSSIPARHAIKRGAVQTVASHVPTQAVRLSRVPVAHVAWVAQRALQRTPNILALHLFPTLPTALVRHPATVLGRGPVPLGRRSIDVQTIVERRPDLQVGYPVVSIGIRPRRPTLRRTAAMDLVSVLPMTQPRRHQMVQTELVTPATRLPPESIVPILRMRAVQTEPLERPVPLAGAPPRTPAIQTEGVAVQVEPPAVRLEEPTMLALPSVSPSRPSLARRLPVGAVFIAPIAPPMTTPAVRHRSTQTEEQEGVSTTSLPATPTSSRFTAVASEVSLFIPPLADIRPFEQVPSPRTVPIVPPLPLARDLRPAAAPSVVARRLLSRSALLHIRLDREIREPSPALLPISRPPLARRLTRQDHRMVTVRRLYTSHEAQTDRCPLQRMVVMRINMQQQIVLAAEPQLPPPLDATIVVTLRQRLQAVEQEREELRRCLLTVQETSMDEATGLRQRIAELEARNAVLQEEMRSATAAHAEQLQMQQERATKAEAQYRQQLHESLSKIERALAARPTMRAATPFGPQIQEPVAVEDELRVEMFELEHLAAAPALLTEEQGPAEAAEVSKRLLPRHRLPALDVIPLKAELPPLVVAPHREARRPPYPEQSERPERKKPLGRLIRPPTALEPKIAPLTKVTCEDLIRELQLARQFLSSAKDRQQHQCHPATEV